MKISTSFSAWVLIMSISNVAHAGFIQETNANHASSAMQVSSAPERPPHAPVPDGLSPLQQYSASNPKSGFDLVSIKYIGDPTGVVSVVNEGGKSVALTNAIRSIVPAGWQVFFQEDVMGQEKEASWASGRTWIATLDIIGNDAGLSVEVDWPRQYVYVSEKKKPLSSIEAGNLESDSAAGATWEVKSGANLRATLQEWSTNAGWTLVWGLPDDADFRFDTGNIYVKDFKATIHDLFNSLPHTVRIRAELRPDNIPPLLYITNQEGTR